jgi:hypothetical protein
MRWSQPFAVEKISFDFMKRSLLFDALTAAKGGSAYSR